MSLVKPNLLLIVFLYVGNLHAQTLEPIFFTSKLEEKSDDSLNATYEVNAGELSSQNSARIVDILKEVPGIEISQTGAVGGEASIYIRGAEARHTLILVDGVKVYDPTSTARIQNLALLNTRDIEKIEILKGAQSVLYGSDAIGGVVNIITKKASSRSKLKLSGGYYQQAYAETTAPLGSSLLYLSGNYQQSKYMSQAHDGDEKDATELRSLTINHMYERNDWEFKTLLKAQENYAEVDSYDFITSQITDDLKAYAKNRQLTFQEHIQKEKIDFVFAVNRYERVNRSDKYYLFDGSVIESELRYKLNKSELLGVQFLQETYRDDDISERSLSMYDAFYLNKVRRDNWQYEYGARATYNQNFGNYGVYQLGMSYQLSADQSFKLTHQTGFKAPSLYQQQAPADQYGPIGNEDLSPEKSRELNLMHEWKSSLVRVETSLFYREVEDFIDFQFGNGYQNLLGVITRGVEVNSSHAFSKSKLKASLSLLNFSSSNGTEVVRRPNFSFNFNYQAKLTDQHSLGVNWTWKGRRFDTKGAEFIQLRPYDTLDVNYRYQKGAWLAEASVKNVFAREYEVVSGYSVLERAVLISIAKEI